MKCNKIILTIAGLLVLFGAGLSALAVFMGAATPENSVLQTQTADSSVSNINISSSVGDVRFVSADTDKITVTYTIEKTIQYRFHADSDTLSLEAIPTRQLGLKWYDYIDFHFGSRAGQITVTVPRDFSADITLDSNYGDISLSGLKGSMQLNADCGDVKLEHCAFSTFVCKLDYGDIELEQVSADTFQITNSCGDIEAKDISGDISASCDFGDIELERVTGKHIALDNNCGDIDCVILGSELDYTIDAETHMGDKNIQNRQGGNHTLHAKTAMGDISVTFE
ncbi:MAG: DUF4097 domain-containing protein [Clostridia bacterium]|nr:DUF4097 domain-containing protein [Clostridia bacterium]